MKRQYGFTLIEVMVVVLIVATLSAFSLFAIQQVTGRRLGQRASDLQGWLNDLPNRAILEGTAYGVYPDKEGLHPMVYFRNQWFIARSPETFSLPGDVKTRWYLATTAMAIGDTEAAIGKVKPVLPVLAVLPSGEFVPAGRVELRSEGVATVYRLAWGGEESGIQLSTVAEP